jgi:hypothetical protein
MIAVVLSDAEQPVHLRVTSGGNAQTLVSGEQLTARTDAFVQLEALARELGILNARVNLSGDRYYLTGGDRPVEIRFLDEREEKGR